MSRKRSWKEWILGQRFPEVEDDDEDYDETADEPLAEETPRKRNLVPRHNFKSDYERETLLEYKTFDVINIVFDVTTVAHRR